MLVRPLRNWLLLFLTSFNNHMINNNNKLIAISFSNTKVLMLACNVQQEIKVLKKSCPTRMSMNVISMVGTPMFTNWHSGQTISLYFGDPKFNFFTISNFVLNDFHVGKKTNLPFNSCLFLVLTTLTSFNVRQGASFDDYGYKFYMPTMGTMELYPMHNRFHKAFSIVFPL